MKGATNVNIAQGCQLLGFTRQAYYKTVAVKQDTFDLEIRLTRLVEKSREGCPGKGCRAIYKKNSNELSVGRDKAEALMRSLELMVAKKSK